MTAKSPTMSLKVREMIGEEQFSQRREVFDKYDTVFLPPASPVLVPASDVDPIITSNHGKTTTNFKRNTPGYSSMRESRTDERNHDFRPRKYSDNFTSELNQSDNVDYRHTMTERTRRLSKLRRDFMTSNLHEPGDSPFNRAGTRSSLPAKSYTAQSPILKYKIESPNIYKFPFAEPYSTPTPVRKVIVKLGSTELDGKENEDPERKRHLSVPDNNNTTKIDQQKLFEDLVKRYSPQRKPIDWKLPPTKPRVIASVPKPSADSVDSDSQNVEDKSVKQSGDDDVFEKKDAEEGKKTDTQIVNGTDSVNDKDGDKENESKTSLSELEKNDEVPELGTFQRQLSKESHKKPIHTEVVDLTIPALIEKMTAEGEDLENHKKENKKVKRKRSFLDKLLGRNKNK